MARPRINVRQEIDDFTSTYKKMSEALQNQRQEEDPTTEVANRAKQAAPGLGGLSGSGGDAPAFKKGGAVKTAKPPKFAGYVKPRQRSIGEHSKK